MDQQLTAPGAVDVLDNGGGYGRFLTAHLGESATIYVGGRTAIVGKLVSFDDTNLLVRTVYGKDALIPRGLAVVEFTQRDQDGQQ